EWSQRPAQSADLGIVGCDNEHVGRLERTRTAFLVGPPCARKEMSNDAHDGVDFLFGSRLVSLVRNFDEKKASAGEGRVAFQPLTLELIDGLQALLVVELGREGADARMEPPGTVEEQALVVCQGLSFLAEHVH